MSHIIFQVSKLPHDNSNRIPEMETSPASFILVIDQSLGQLSQLLFKNCRVISEDNGYTFCHMNHTESTTYQSITRYKGVDAMEQISYCMLLPWPHHDHKDFIRALHPHINLHHNLLTQLRLIHFGWALIIAHSLADKPFGSLEWSWRPSHRWLNALFGDWMCDLNGSLPWKGRVGWSRWKQLWAYTAPVALWGCSLIWQREKKWDDKKRRHISWNSAESLNPR